MVRNILVKDIRIYFWNLHVQVYDGVLLARVGLVDLALLLRLQPCQPRIHSFSIGILLFDRLRLATPKIILLKCIHELKMYPQEITKLCYAAMPSVPNQIRGYF